VHDRPDSSRTITPKSAFEPNFPVPSVHSIGGIAFRKMPAHSGDEPLAKEVCQPRFKKGLFYTGSMEAKLMNLTISGHHLEVTPALRDYVTGKLDRITRHFDQVVDVKVLLTVEKQKEKEKRQRAECNIHVKGNDMFAESAHEDLYAAVDDLVDKLDRQVVKHKDRITHHHHSAPKRMM
jgi:putative sigma-54 modulation protein